MQQPNNVDTNGQESKYHNLHFMFLTYVTRNQGHSHQTWYESVGPKEDYSHAKFGSPCLKTPMFKFLSHQKHVSNHA